MGARIYLLFRYIKTLRRHKRSYLFLCPWIRRTAASYIYIRPWSILSSWRWLQCGVGGGELPPPAPKLRSFFEAPPGGRRTRALATNTPSRIGIRFKHRVHNLIYCFSFYFSPSHFIHLSSLNYQLFTSLFLQNHSKSLFSLIFYPILEDFFLLFFLR